MKISPTAIIHPNVTFGHNCVVEDFAIVGAPPHNCEPGEWETTIGDNAVIRAHSIIYAGNVIGNDFQTGNKANIRESNQIGDNVSVGTLSVVEHHVRIGNGVRIHTQAFIPEYCELEDGCWIGPNVVFTNAKYPRSPNVKDELKGPYIGVGAIVAANSTLLPAVKIGREAIVGAGSVVTKDVADYSVVAGSPARHMKWKADLPYPVTGSRKSA